MTSAFSEYVLINVFACVLQVFALPWTPTTPKLIYQMLEEQPIGTQLTQLQATDSDSNIEAYQLSTNDYLEINNLTGKCVLNGKLLGFCSGTCNKLIYRSVDWLQLNVQCITSHLKWLNEILLPLQALLFPLLQEIQRN